MSNPSILIDKELLDDIQAVLLCASRDNCRPQLNPKYLADAAKFFGKDVAPEVSQAITDHTGGPPSLAPWHFTAQDKVYVMMPMRPARVQA